MKTLMKNLTHVSICTFLFYTIPSFADLPLGAFSGFVSGNYGEFCRINQAEVQFIPEEKGAYQLHWEEHGYQSAFGGGFCDIYLDAQLQPAGKANEWDVRFLDRTDLIFGKAVLNGTLIQINANFSGFQNWANLLRAEFNVGEKQNTLDYRRAIESNFGPTHTATGILAR